MGGGGIVRVDNDVEAGGDIRVQGPHGDDEVDGLELVDEGVCLDEVGAVLLCVRGASRRTPPPPSQAGIGAFDGRGEKVNAVPPLGVGTEPSHVLVDLRVDLGGTGPWRPRRPARSRLMKRRAAGMQFAMWVRWPSRPSRLWRAFLIIVGRESQRSHSSRTAQSFSSMYAERHSLLADLKPEPYKAGDGGHALVGRWPRQPQMARR